jgi:phosphatidylserine decarboxylase
VSYIVVKDGLPYIIFPLLVASIFVFFKLWLLAIPLLLLALFMAYFFRDPEREIPKEADIIVSPADGRVTRIENVESESGSFILVSIFLSPLDVHINRSPIAGRIKSQNYIKGKFKIATSRDASLVNEQNVLEIGNDDITVICKQIAGILARRIVCWRKAGDEVGLGERFGLIKFSSRTDLVMPDTVEVLVKKGERVRGGSTIVGRIRNV